MAARIISNHSTWIEGALDFAVWLSKKTGVAYIIQGNVRSSHVRAGRKDPKFTPQKYAVAATWYCGGKLQIMMVFATSDFTIHQLAEDLKAAWIKAQSRGGIPGESSKAPVGEPIIGSAVTPNPIPIEQLRKEPPEQVTVVMSQLASQAYQLLLDQGGDAERFTIMAASALLVKELGMVGMVNSMSELRRLGLLSKGIKQPRGREKAFSVLRRPFEVRSAMHERGMRVGTVPVEFLEMDPTEHLAFFERHKVVLEEAKLRAKALKRHGFEVTEFRGQLSLTKITRTRA